MHELKSMQPMRARFLSIWLVASILPVACCAADEMGPFVQLFDADSLTGWEYGGFDPRGWQMSGGVLTARGPKTPLVAGWTFGDFDLKFEYTVEPDSGWKLRLRTPYGANVGEISILGNGLISELGQHSRAPENAGSVTAKQHNVELRRRGKRLYVIAAGQNPVAVPLTGDERCGLELAAIGPGRGTISRLRAAQPPGEPLVNGPDLIGWWTPGNRKAWRASDGQIECVGPKGDYLRSLREYGNFRLTFDYKLAPGGNSGVAIRTPHDGWPSLDGIELQLLNLPPRAGDERHATMSIYGRVEPLGRFDQPDSWNRVVVEAQGPMISAWVNGALAQHVDIARLPELRFTPSHGWIGLQDHGADVAFRDLRIVELPAGQTPRSWNRPQTTRGGELVINRLINSGALASPEQSQTQWYAAKTADANEAVLAQLTGPGAVVGISRNHDRGTLAFYFGAQATPGLECPAAELAQHVPMLAKDGQPLATYIPFRKSLKITLRDGPPADYRFDVIAFGPSIAVEDFAGPEKTITRGWLSSLTRRYEELGFRVHRQHGAIEHVHSPPKTIQPGQTEKLLQIWGGGVVRALKLRIPPVALANDDLWLIVNIAYLERPVIECPMRYLFPGLGRTNRYQNFVVLDCDGYTSILTMPHEETLSISVANRGTRPFKDVAATVLRNNSQVPHGQLHADFLRAGTGDIVKLAGKGRWIGLVYDASVGELPATGPLVVDGHAHEAWTAKSLAVDFGLMQDATGDHSSDARGALSGRADGLAWRWLLAAPAEFDRSLVLRAGNGAKLADRVVFYYLDPNGSYSAK